MSNTKYTEILSGILPESVIRQFEGWSIARGINQKQETIRYSINGLKCIIEVPNELASVLPLDIVLQVFPDGEQCRAYLDNPANGYYIPEEA